MGQAAAGRGGGRPGALGPGVVVGGVAVAVVLGALAAVAAAGGGAPGGLLGDPYLRHVVGFTLGQAALSTLASAVVGVALARALHRRCGAGRWPLLAISVAMVTPATVAAMGVVAVWGRGGWLAAAGLPVPDVYGLTGIVLGHVFLNAPLMARLFHGALVAIPAGRWRLAAHLGLGPWAVWRLVEAPALARVLPGAVGLVFLLCATSFALVLLLGGGPGAATLEVAIYQAARLEFDLGRAAGLALVQLAFCGAVVAAMSRLPVEWAVGRGGRPVARPAPGGWAGDAVALGLALVLVGAPLAALVARGLAGLGGLAAEPLFPQALATSLGLALAAAVVTPLCALALAEARATLALPGRRGPRPWGVLAVDLASALPLAVPASVLALGAFLALRGWADAFALAPGLVLAGNVLLALPLATRAVQARLAEVAARHDRLAAALGLRGLARFRLVEWPLLRREIGFAAGLSAALSLGDLGLAAFFGGPGVATLPWLIYQTAGRYQTEAAAAMALALMLLALALFVGIERLVGGRDAAR